MVAFLARYQGVSWYAKGERPIVVTTALSRPVGTLGKLPEVATVRPLDSLIPYTTSPVRMWQLSRWIDRLRQDARRVEAIVAEGVGTRFDPGHGRLKKEWLAIGEASDKTWLALATESEGFVARRR